MQVEGKKAKASSTKNICIQYYQVSTLFLYTSSPSLDLVSRGQTLPPEAHWAPGLAGGAMHAGLHAPYVKLQTC